MFSNKLLTKTYQAGGTIYGARIVKFGASNTTVLQSAAGTDIHIGISGSLNITASSGEDVDVALEGIAELTLGGSVTRGDLLTSDSVGRGLRAGDGDRHVAIALQSGVSGDAIPVLLDRGRVDFGATVTASPAELNVLQDAPADCTFTIAEETGNVVNVAGQLKDADGNNLATRRSVRAYLSGVSTGATLATAPSGGVAIGTNGLLIETVADRSFEVVTNGSGAFDLNITEAGAATFYLVVVMPSGLLKISNAITFA